MQTVYLSLSDSLTRITEILNLNMFWLQGFVIAGSIGLFSLALIMRISYIRKADVLLLEQKKSELRQGLFRAQLNYHFTFNALNSIKSMINRQENERASVCVSKFAGLTRELLDLSDKKEISIAEEVNILRLYLDIERTRTRDKFDYQIVIDPEIDPEEADIPPMLLQPFVENAIWHGMKPLVGQGQLHISFRKSGNLITATVEDNGIGRKESKELKRASVWQRDSRGIALIRERIDHLNVLRSEPLALAVLDLESVKGQALGTRVEISIPIL